MDLIRHASRADSRRMNEIYNPTIIDNHVSFATEPWTLEMRERWWDSRSDDLPVLVAEVDGRVVGVTYGSRYRPKSAYFSSVETTVVLDDDVHGRGLGTRLLGALLDELVERGFHRAIAIISMPNDASIALHHKLGYRTIGIMSEAGFKLGRYWDVAMLERVLEPTR